MNLTEICIIKRDGKRENFSPSKITNAISKAFNATGLAHQEELIDEITRRVIAHFENPTIGVEEIQDLVETELMKVQPEVAKKVYHLPPVEKYGARPQDADEAYHGRYCSHRQE